MALCGKTDSFLLINHFRCDAFDVRFTRATYMAQSVFIFTVILFFVLNEQRRVAWTILLSFLGSGLICLLLKHGFSQFTLAWKARACHYCRIHKNENAYFITSSNYLHNPIVLYKHDFLAIKLEKVLPQYRGGSIVRYWFIFRLMGARKNLGETP